MQEQIEICRDICTKITNKTISTIDFFPYRGIDTSFVPLMFNVKKHGTQTLNDYLTYFSHYYQVKQSINKHCKKLNMFPSEHIRWIKYLSMLEMGIGESEVLSHSLCYHLLNHHIDRPFSILMIENAQHQKHHLILLSPVIPEKNSSFPDILSQLPPDAIILDPYLKFVNSASLYADEHRDFLNTYQFTIISSVKVFSPLSNGDKKNIDLCVKSLYNKLTLHIKSSSDPIEEIRWSIFYNTRPEITQMISQKRQSEFFDEVEPSDTNPVPSC